jgi:putative transposase
MIGDAVRAELTAGRTYRERHAGVRANRTFLMALQPMNHKRMYRMMKAQSRLLPKLPKRLDSRRAQNGRVAVADSNQRWYSDGFEIACDKGDFVTGVS